MLHFDVNVTDETILLHYVKICGSIFPELTDSIQLLLMQGDESNACQLHWFTGNMHNCGFACDHI